MPISPMSFPMLSFQQANPFLTGVQQGQDVFSQALKNITGAQESQQQIESMKLANALQRIGLQTAPQMNQAELAYKQAQLPNLQAQTNKLTQENQYYPQDIQSQIAQRKAQTGLTNEETKYMPLKYALSGLQGLRTSNRFGKSYQLRQELSVMSPPARDAWIADHQDQYAEMLADTAEGDKQQEALNAATLKEMQKYYPEFGGMSMTSNPMQQAQQQPMQGQGAPQQMGQQGMPGQQPQVSPQQLAQSLQQAQQGQQGQSQQQQQQQPDPAVMQGMQQAQQRVWSSTPEQVDRVRTANQLSANQKLAGTQMNQRAQAAVAIESWMENNQKEYAPRLRNASHFAGQLGQGRKTIDQLAKETPQDYQDYIWTKTSFTSNLINQVKMMEHMNGTDSQREELQKMVGALDRMDLDPKSAMRVFNQSVKTLGDISDAVFTAAEPAYKGVYRKTYNLPRLGDDYLGIGKSSKGGDMSHLSDAELRKIAGGK